MKRYNIENTSRKLRAFSYTVDEMLLDYPHCESERRW